MMAAGIGLHRMEERQPVLETLEQYRGRRIVVAMSGGVDSSLAAVLLHRAGAEVIGVHMRVWHEDDCSDLNSKIKTCCTPADAADARRIAEQFDFPFYAIDFEADFRRAVIDPFIRDYLEGRTPIPCVHCNTRLKLGHLLHKAKAWDAEAVATGHYARVRHRPGRPSELLRAPDREKDQSYFLFELSQSQLSHLVMPVGELDKSQTRSAARELGLHLAEKPESQDICFVPDGDYRQFMREEADLDERALGGPIVNTEGRVLGRHRGVHNFTVGQRRGLGLAAERPLYVLELQPESRTVVVGHDEEGYSPGLIAGRINWIGAEATAEPLRVLAKIRYRHAAVAATLIADSKRLGAGRARIEFDEPQRAVSPGQAVVCYDIESGESLIAGGWIERSLATHSSRAKN